MERFIQITLSKLAEKQLAKLPFHIRSSFKIWVNTLVAHGLIETRKKSGYHDEPLSGKRKGQRSVRLSRSYRIIYQVNETGDVILIMILEVNNHDY